MVYGPHASFAYSVWVSLGLIHKYLGETMIITETGETRRNSVHIRDCADAIIHVAKWSIKRKPKTRIYNLSDPSDLQQKHIVQFFQLVTGIKAGFLPPTDDFEAQMVDLVDDMNEYLLSTWNHMLRVAGIRDTPVSPYLDNEFVRIRSFSIDGTKIIRETGFEYKEKSLTFENALEALVDFEERGLWPRVLGKGEIVPVSQIQTDKEI